MTARPLPVPDDTSVAFWEASARHVLTVARCGRCGTLALPPGVVCVECRSTDPEFTFVPVSGRGVVRSWTVVRQAFLPGFEVPFVLVDVELVEQSDLRMIGRLLDGMDAALKIGAEVGVAFEDLDAGSAVAAFEVVR